MAARFRRRTAPRRKRADSEDAYLAAQGQGDHAAYADFLGWLRDALAIDADMALVDERLRQSAAFHQANEEEVAV